MRQKSACACVCVPENYFAQSHLHCMCRLVSLTFLSAFSSLVFFLFFCIVTSRCRNALLKANLSAVPPTVALTTYEFLAIARNNKFACVPSRLRRALPSVFVRKPRTRNKTIPQSVFKNSIHTARQLFLTTSRILWQPPAMQVAQEFPISRYRDTRMQETNSNSKQAAKARTNLEAIPSTVIEFKFFVSKSIGNSHGFRTSDICSLI